MDKFEIKSNDYVFNCTLVDKVWRVTYSGGFITEGKFSFNAPLANLILFIQSIVKS